MSKAYFMSFYLNFRIRILKIKVLWVLPFWESLQKLIYGRLSLLKLKSLKLLSKSVCFLWFRLDYPKKNLDFLFTAFKVTYNLTHSLLFPLYLICTLFEYLFITIPMWRSKKHFWELDLTWPLVFWNGGFSCFCSFILVWLAHKILGHSPISASHLITGALGWKIHVNMSGFLCGF